MQHLQWHAVPSEKVMEAFEVTKENGLSVSHVAKRQRMFGRNELKKHTSFRMLRIIIRLLSSPLSLILIAVAAVTASLGEWVDMAVVLTVLLVNVGIGAFQEGRARRVFDILASSQEKRAVVIRDGKRTIISAEDVVPGDILMLEGGAAVIADARIISANELYVNEASLTGEWAAVIKHMMPIRAHAPLAERDNMVWSGTAIVSGHALAVVVATGETTALGAIATHLTDEGAETKLEKSVRHLARVLLFGIGIVIAIITALGIMQGQPLTDILLIAVALAVAVMPEGLPAAVTVVLAVGMEVILKDGGLVRSLRAAETLGSTTVIITDKTGTLTEGMMSVAALYTVRGIAQKDHTLAHGDNHELLKDAILASDAFVTETAEGLSVHGRAVEKALLTMGLEAGISQDDLFEHGGARLTYLQFESSRRYGASLNQHGTGRKRVYLSGSPEVLLGASRFAMIAGVSRAIDDEMRQNFTRIQDQESARGHRFIGVAYVPTDDDDIAEGIRTGSHIPGTMVFVGLIAFSDRIRGDVFAEIERAKGAGIEVIMATGDYPETARSIAQEVGIANPTTGGVTGEELEKMTDEELLLKLRSGAIFARVIPEHKLRMVHVLRGAGEVVAMTGDGVNDAPALIAADIGVAVGSGTDVAKEASDIVLLNNTFSTITAAIAEGRRIGDNLRKIVAYLLSTSFSEIFLIGGALVVGVPLPLLPTQILWANVIQEGLMSFPFAFEPAEVDAMHRKPRASTEHMVLTPNMWKLITFTTFATGSFLLVLYALLLSLGTAIEEIRTVLFIGLTFSALFFTLSFKDLHRPLWRMKILNNPWIIGALLVNVFLLVVTVTFPPLRDLLSLTSLTVVDLVLLVILGLVNLFTIELGKAFFFRNERVVTA